MEKTIATFSLSRMEEWFLHLDYRFLGMHHDYRCRKKIMKEGQNIYILHLIIMIMVTSNAEVSAGSYSQARHFTVLDSMQM